MPKLPGEDDHPMKTNLLPFPALQAAPRDPPRPTVWRALGTLVMLAIALGLFALTLYALFE